MNRRAGTRYAAHHNTDPGPAAAGDEFVLTLAHHGDASDNWRSTDMHSLHEALAREHRYDLRRSAARARQLNYLRAVRRAGRLERLARSAHERLGQDEARRLAD